MFLAINWKSKGEKDSREGWVLQPAWRVKRGWWKYKPPIAGPFRTKKIAQQVKKFFVENVEWR